MELKARVTLVMTGFGELTLTGTALVWQKTLRHFLAFGVFGGMSANYLVIQIAEIASIGTYRYSGGGLVVMLKDGRKHKIGFKRKSDFEMFYDRLSEMIK